MIIQEFNGNIHDWEKQNLITLGTGRKSHDKYKCKKCGITAKSINLAQVSIPGQFKNKAWNCSNSAESKKAGKKVRVIHCNANGRQFENLTPNSEHYIVDTPQQYVSKKLNGVWVMGVGEPVRLIPGEYTLID